MTQYNLPSDNFSAPTLIAPPQQREAPEQHSYWSGYVLWFSAEVWRDAARRWTGIGVRYMLLLLAISWAIVMLNGYLALLQAVKEDLPRFIVDLPPMKIENGIVTADVKQPHFLMDPDTGKPYAVIDTTGSTLFPPKEGMSFLVDRDEILIHRDPGRLSRHKLSFLKEPIEFDRDSVQQAAEKFVKLYLPVGYPTALVISLLYRLTWMAIFALVGLAMSLSVRPALSFKALMRLAALAMTPTIIVETGAAFLGIMSPGCMWWIAKTTFEIFLFRGMIKANNDPYAPVEYPALAVPVGAVGMTPPPLPPRTF